MQKTLAIWLHYLLSLSIWNYNLICNHTSFPRQETTSPRSFIFLISGSAIGLFRAILEQPSHPYWMILRSLFTISCASSPLSTLQLRLHSRIGPHQQNLHSPYHKSQSKLPSQIPGLVLLVATTPWLYSHYRIGSDFPNSSLSSGVSWLKSELGLLSTFRNYLVFTESAHPLFCIDFAVFIGTTATPLVNLSPILDAWIGITRPGVCFTASLNNDSALLYFPLPKIPFTPRQSNTAFAYISLVAPTLQSQPFVHQEHPRNSLLWFYAFSPTTYIPPLTIRILA